MHQNAVPDAVQFRTRRDVSLTLRAVKDRISVLGKLADKSESEGYEKEGRTQRADAAALQTFVLPQFADQAELPLVTLDDLRVQIGESIRDVVAGSLVVRAPEEKQVDMLRSREDGLVEKLASRIESFATQIAEAAFEAGYASRRHEPLVIAKDALFALQGGRD